MIRLIVLIVFGFLLWVLFASGFDRVRKIVISIAAVVVCAAVLLVDGYAKRESKSLIANADIGICGVAAKHTYRTNFDVSICLENQHSSATLTRIDMRVIASNCNASGCTELERVARDIPMQLGPKAQQNVIQNLSFNDVDPQAENVDWSLEIVTTKGVR